mgnify:CR=1 FL=1
MAVGVWHRRKRRYGFEVFAFLVELSNVLSEVRLWRRVDIVGSWEFVLVSDLMVRRRSTSNTTVTQYPKFGPG